MKLRSVSRGTKCNIVLLEIVLLELGLILLAEFTDGNAETLIPIPPTPGNQVVWVEI